MAIKQALAILDSLSNSNYLPQIGLSPKQVKENGRNIYYQCVDTYAVILYMKNKYKDALIYEQRVYNNVKLQDANISLHYAMILNANNMHKIALDVIEKCFARGVTSPALITELEKSYIKINGGIKGFNEYLNALNKSADKERLAETAKSVISLPAPAFDLKDMSGNKVALASLKGKVVVIDFWANWCEPCKMAFPGMQAAINKYKGDPDVKFIFIDTWEIGDGYIRDTKKYMAENKYDFDVLFDEVASDGRLSKVRIKYGIDSLPTKIVIDKNGNIRFKVSGYSGSSQALVDELTSMIELARNY
jgi:thiol-disulfide isomerase/thioredoxin